MLPSSPPHTTAHKNNQSVHAMLHFAWCSSECWQVFNTQFSTAKFLEFILYFTGVPLWGDGRPMVSNFALGVDEKCLSHDPHFGHTVADFFTPDAIGP